MEVTRSSETSVYIRTTRRYNMQFGTVLVTAEHFILPATFHVNLQQPVESKSLQCVVSEIKLV
jgi:hypothetical protein